MASAYDLAARLFSGRYRPSGKTFVAHVCGTASITQLAGGSVDETVAALLHAAYDHGDFGDGRTSADPRKRAEVRAVVGTHAEALVAEYSAWAWRTRIEVLRRDGDGALDDWERPLALLRLANELDERVDLGSAHSSMQTAHAYPLEAVVECARRLDRPALADLALAVQATNAGHEVPPSLVRHGLRSEVLMPRSATTRVRARLARVPSSARHLARRIARHVPGARRAAHAWRRRQLP